MKYLTGARERPIIVYSHIVCSHTMKELRKPSNHSQCYNQHSDFIPCLKGSDKYELKFRNKFNDNVYWQMVMNIESEGNTMHHVSEQL